MSTALRLARAAACASLWALATTCSRPPPPRANVLLITIDTLRADRLSARTMPELERLAQEGLLFTHASTPRAKTTPALASLMTGLYPHEHGVRDVLVPLGLEHATLAERLRERGWRTGAIVGNYVLQARFSGLERGFEQWSEELPDTQGVPPDDVPQRTARSLTDGALAALGLAPRAASRADDGGTSSAKLARAGEPWFLWLHYMDPHGSYAPPPEHRVFASASEPLPPAPEDASSARRSIAEYNVPPEARLADGRIDAARVRDLYDGEVHYVDAEIGRLLEHLRASGELARTLVVVTADHGESLGEHEYWFEHGRDAYEACSRVPLVVRMPQGKRPASTSELPSKDDAIRDDDISLADLAPTVLEWAGLPPLHADAAKGLVRGRSLLAAWRGGARQHAPVFGEKVDRAEVELAVQHKTARLGDWKLVQRFAQVPARDGAPAGALRLLDEQLYELASDPREERDLAASTPERAPLAELRRALARFVAADGRFASVAGELALRRARLERDDPDALRILQSLGY